MKPLSAGGSGGYDLIGDLHGFAGPLRTLLARWGYNADGAGAYRHPAGRRIIFVGDYVDRGPEIVATLRIVRAMVESGEAVALMGNHEYNAIALDHVVDGVPLRPECKRVQHADTIRQLEAAGEDRREWLEWFKTLPLWHEEEAFRVVHACWDERHLAVLRAGRPDGRLRAPDWDALADATGALAQAVEGVLKGPEVPLPGGRWFHAAEGHARREMRLRWWGSPQPATWREASVGEWREEWGEVPFGRTLVEGRGYPPEDRPVFFGHYWLRGEPVWLAENVCCLDYSVAKQGHLVGYRMRPGQGRSGRFERVVHDVRA